VVVRIALGAAALLLIVLALRHPAPAPTFAGAPSAVAPVFSPALRDRHERRWPARDGAALVYVVGAVVRPGLYHLAADSRTVDALKAAGGLTRAADPVAVNLAAFVRDGDEIVVPEIGQSQMHERTPKHHSRKRRGHQLPGSTLDVNVAGADDLAVVPGIGRAIAQRIVEMRERLGPFGSLDELLDVAGMTDERLERARPFLTVGTLQ
jgi:competence protein ComEA